MNDNHLKENSKTEDIDEISRNTVDDILNFASNEVKELKKSKKKKKHKNLGDLAKNTVDDIFSSALAENEEKPIAIIFTSVDQKIHFSIICKNTDTINKLEAELYREYPQFSETDNYFMCKGKVLNKFHPFESDNIKNGDVIIVDKRDI